MVATAAPGVVFSRLDSHNGGEFASLAKKD
jgi:hypothetical protein